MIINISFLTWKANVQVKLPLTKFLLLNLGVSFGNNDCINKWSAKVLNPFRFMDTIGQFCLEINCSTSVFLKLLPEAETRIFFIIIYKQT